MNARLTQWLPLPRLLAASLHARAGSPNGLLVLVSRMRPALSLCGLAGILTSSPTAYASEATLCNARETVVFSCSLKSAKIASVCSASGPGQDYVAYRFGKPGKIELTYQADAAHPGQVFHRAKVVGASNAEDRIWFTNRGHLYRIYSPMRGFPGLEVSRNGATVARLECKGDWTEAIEAGKTRSRFILDHGSGRDGDFEHLETPR